MNAANIVNTNDARNLQEQRLQIASLIAVFFALAGIVLCINLAIINIEAPDAFKDMRVAEADCIMPTPATRSTGGPPIPLVQATLGHSSMVTGRHTHARPPESGGKYLAV